MIKLVTSTIGITLLLHASIFATDIHQASKDGHLDEVQACVMSDSSLINKQNSDGNTPLHEAIRGDHIDIVRYLLDKGADSSIENKYGVSALRLAKALMRQEMVVLMIPTVVTNKGPTTVTLNGTLIKDIKSVSLNKDTGKITILYSAASGGAYAPSTFEPEFLEAWGIHREELVRIEKEKQEAKDAAEAARENAARIAQKQREEEQTSNKAGLKTTNAKEIDTFGEDMLGQTVQMMCTFIEVNNIHVRYSIKDDDYVGFVIDDENGVSFHHLVADKAKYGRDLLKLKRGAKMRLVGKIKQVGRLYYFFVEQIFIQSQD
jgi:uncharacterized FlaG/YvyC family protein